MAVHILLTNHLSEFINADSLILPSLLPTLTDIDATVTIEVPIDFLKDTFYFKTDEAIATDATDDVHCYVDTSKWPSMQGYLNASYGNISISDNAFVDSDVIAKDFLRNVANGLFGTHLGVDLFTNETSVHGNLETQTSNVANNIFNSIQDVGITGGDTDLSTDENNEKYFLDTVDDPKNVTRALLLQLLSLAPERFNSINLPDHMYPGKTGTYRMPLIAGDTLSYALTIHPDVNQNTITNTGTNALPRKYRVKLVCLPPLSLFGTIQGSVANENFGIRISLNGDGTRIAVSSRLGNTAYKVKCFQYSNSSWTQLGSTLSLAPTYIVVTPIVSMDASGNSFSVSPSIDGRQEPSYVYDLDGANEWQLRGGSSFLTGGNKGSNHASKLSGNGEYFWTTSWSNHGSAGVQQWNYDGTSWVLTRVSSYGQSPRTNHIDVSYDGSVLVGTSSYAAGGHGLHEFFVFPPTGTSIIKPADISGNAISANLDCTRVAMISHDYQYVRVYDKGADWSTWTLVGNEVNTGGEMSSLAISEDGIRFVVGNPGWDSPVTDAGIIKVYELQEGVWKKLYEETGTSTNDRVGGSVDISDFGAVIANGRYDANALTNMGRVDLLS